MWWMFANIYFFLPLNLSNGVKRGVIAYDEFRFHPEILCNSVWSKLENIYLFVPLTLSNGVKRDVVESDEFRFQGEIICNAVWRMFANIYLYLPLILSNGVTRHVVECDKLRIQQEIICNDVWRKFANIYLFLPLTLSNGVIRDVVEYDELRFQREIICNDVCENVRKYRFIFPPYFIKWGHSTCYWVWWTPISARSHLKCLCEDVLQNCIYFCRWFSQMVSHDMLLSMINSDFIQKSFVNLCEECFQIYGLPLTLWNGAKRDVVKYDEFRFQREIICNVVCDGCSKISLDIYPLFYQMVCHTTCC